MSSNPPTMPVFAPGITPYTNFQSIADAFNWSVGTPRSGQTRRPYFWLQQTVAQTMTTSGTDYAILFDTEAADTDSGHSTSTNTSRYTAQTAGLYQFWSTIGFVGNSTGNRRACLRYNGGTTWWNRFQAPAPSPTDTFIGTEGLLYLNVGDYVELVGRQTSGGSLNTSTAFTGSLLAGLMLTA